MCDMTHAYVCSFTNSKDLCTSCADTEVVPAGVSSTWRIHMCDETDADV